MPPGHFATGDHVIVVATGERAFVTGFFLPGQDVRVLLESEKRFVTLRPSEIAREELD